MDVTGRLILVVMFILVTCLAGCLHGTTGSGEQRAVDERPDVSGNASAGHGASSASNGSGEDMSSAVTLSTERVQPGWIEFNYTTRDYTIEGESVAGTYIADVNRDGFPDLLTIGGSSYFRDDPLPILYRNVRGEGFVRQREFDLSFNVSAALFFDYDNDGWDDLLLLNHQGDDAASVFFENRNGSLVRKEVGLERRFQAARGATTADYDRDGCLDVFVVQAADWHDRRPTGVGTVGIAGSDDNGQQNMLFDGDCDRFEPVSDAGIRGRHWSLATSFADFTGDGYPDIHVANDFFQDVVYINQRNGTFSRRLLGPDTDRNGMSSEVADVNRDGRPDIFVSNIFVPTDDPRTIPAVEARFGDRIDGNNLLINTEEGFVDRAETYGVRKSRWGWAAVIDDFDNDGDRDIFQATTSPAVPVANTYWERRGDGFVKRPSASIKSLNATPQLESMGAARLDVDRDGVPDLALSNVRDWYYVHDVDVGGAGNDWLQVDVRPAPDQTAIGSRVVIEHDDGRTRRFVTARSDYASQDSRIVHVGLGEDARVDRVRVRWPDGREATQTNVTTNTRVIAEPRGRIHPDGRGSATVPAP